MLVEGMIKISPEEGNTIKKYFSFIFRYSNKLFLREDGGTKSLPSDYVGYKLTEYSNKINPFNLVIHYIFSPSLDNGWYNHKDKTITINLHSTSNYSRQTYYPSPLPDDYVPSSKKEMLIYLILGIKKPELMRVFIHEYIHYKQDTARKEKSGEYSLPKNWNTKDYLSRPWENQAWAADYIEFLRGKMKITKPQEILKQLQRMGVMHDPDLNKLKKQDFKAWKRIMKNAIMYALQATK